MSQRCLICKAVSTPSFFPPAVSLPSNPDTRAFSILAVFHRAYKFNSDVSKWDVSKVSTMYRSKYSFLPSPAVSLPSNPDTRAFSLLAVFSYAYQFNSDVSKWDVSKVSTMYDSKYSFLPSPAVSLPSNPDTRLLSPRSVLARIQVQQRREQVGCLKGV
jgi:surface protein